MNTYKGVIKGNTIVLEERVNLPEGIRAQVVIKPIRPTPKEVIRKQAELMEEAPRVGRLLYKTREELHEW